MNIKKRFGSLQNDLKKKALLALAATGIAFGSLGGIAVAQEFIAVPQEATIALESALVSDVETIAFDTSAVDQLAKIQPADAQMAAALDESFLLFAPVDQFNAALAAQGIVPAVNASEVTPIVQSTVVESASGNSFASVLATADPAAWSNPVDITIASTTVADPSQFNSLASVLAAAETATGANGGTVTSVNAGDSTPWWAVSLIVFGATATLMALTYFAMSMVAAARRPSLSPMGA